MNTINFDKKHIFDFIVFDPDKKEIYKGLVNVKAWNKTIENSEVWEYIPDNARVINKDFSPLIVDLKAVTVIDDNIHIPLKSPESKTSQQSSHLMEDDILTKLENIIKSRKNDTSGKSYTSHLFEKGEEKILKKLGEEAIELLLAKDNEKEIIYESADMIYHLLVYFVYKDIPFNEVLAELRRRMDA